MKNISYSIKWNIKKDAYTSFAVVFLNITGREVLLGEVPIQTSEMITIKPALKEMYIREKQLMSNIPMAQIYTEWWRKQ